jgi:hypothetical protein
MYGIANCVTIHFQHCINPPFCSLLPALCPLLSLRMLMHAFLDFFNQLSVEGIEVFRAAARNKTFVYYHFFVFPVYARIYQIRFN